MPYLLVDNSLPGLKWKTANMCYTFNDNRDFLKLPINYFAFNQLFVFNVNTNTIDFFQRQKIYKFYSRLHTTNNVILTTCYYGKC